MNIDQETLAAILQVGGQYFLPIAALLRALYSGMRGRMPEGTRQIALAAIGPRTQIAKELGIGSAQ